MLLQFIYLAEYKLNILASFHHSCCGSPPQKCWLFFPHFHYHLRTHPMRYDIGTISCIGIMSRILHIYIWKISCKKSITAIVHQPKQFPWLTLGPKIKTITIKMQWLPMRCFTSMYCFIPIIDIQNIDNHWNMAQNAKI